MNDLYASIIHDVKNQLAELSLRLGQRGDAQQEVGITMAAARRLSEMLLLYRDDNGQLRVNIDTRDPAGFLEILAAEYRELFPALAFQVDTSRAPAFAFFDDILVRMALGNALHNASHAARSLVRLAVYQQDNMLVFEVADDGPGYPEGLLQTAGATPAQVSGVGTGLGLFLARKISALHQSQGRSGCIELCNASGAVFRMFLP